MEYSIDGVRIYGSTAGVDYVPGQETLVFVHGAGMDHSIWVLFSRFFARNGFNCIAVDLPGHGKSAGTPLSTVEQMAEWLGVFMDTALIEHATLIGHSMGSLVAIEAASRLQDRISGLILLGAACPMPVGEPLLSAAEQNRHSAVDMIMLYGHAYCSQLGGNPVAGVNIVNHNMRLLERALNGTLFTDLNACNVYSNGLEAANKIRAPCSLILGKEDKMTPVAATQGLIQSLSRASVSILDDCGHMMLAEQPEQVHRAMVAALSNRSAAG